MIYEIRIILNKYFFIFKKKLSFNAKIQSDCSNIKEIEDRRD